MAPHLAYISAGIRFALFRLRSPLVTESLLLSLPPLNKMLQSSGFAILSDKCSKTLRGRIR